MVGTLARPDYRDSLNKLLPRGRAWATEGDTTLESLVDAVAEELAQIDLVAAGLLVDVRPNTTFDLLADWERVVGLPDDCSDLGSTIGERRASLLEKIVTKPTLNPSEFERIGETFGVTITVEELDQTRADAIAGLDTSGGKWRFVWWIEIPLSADLRTFRVTSRVNEPLATFARNTELECRLEKAAPAHTHLVVGYV